MMKNIWAAAMVKAAMDMTTLRYRTGWLCAVAGPPVVHVAVHAGQPWMSMEKKMRFMQTNDGQKCNCPRVVLFRPVFIFRSRKITGRNETLGQIAFLAFFVLHEPHFLPMLHPGLAGMTAACTTGGQLRA